MFVAEKYPAERSFLIPDLTKTVVRLIVINKKKTYSTNKKKVKF